MNLGYWCKLTKTSFKDLQEHLGCSRETFTKLRYGNYTKGDFKILLKIVVLTQGAVQIQDLVDPMILRELAQYKKSLEKFFLDHPLTEKTQILQGLRKVYSGEL